MQARACAVPAVAPSSKGCNRVSPMHCGCPTYFHKDMKRHCLVAPAPTERAGNALLEQRLGPPTEGRHGNNSPSEVAGGNELSGMGCCVLPMPTLVGIGLNFFI